MLLPSLSRAREAAKRAVCANNEKQIGTAMSMYHGAFDEHYPLHGNWATILGAQGSTNSYGGLTPPESRPLNAFLDDTGKVAECPSDNGDPFVNGATNAFEKWGNSYLTNWNMNAFAVLKVTSNNGNSLPRHSDWDDPVKKIVIGDWTWHGNRPIASQQTRWHHPKNRQFNMLFADGHVEYFTFPVGIESMLSTAPDSSRGFY